MQTAKHKGISRLAPTMDASKPYDPPKPNAAAKAMMSSIEWRFGVNWEVTSLSAFLMAAKEMGLNTHTWFQEEMHPLMMQSFQALKGKRNDPDLPSLMESVNSPHAEEFWKTTDAKIAGLEAKQAWEVVERSSMPPGMKAVPGTWA
jgi:hypothetical protein